ncbi:MAG: DUF4340 domain-containing protein, partial [Spirochaetales bacterium]|nr:DUF4340 domain-containing protein [Spirochaetales bacterium]
LDKPAAQVFIQSANASLRVLFGKSNGTMQFAKLGGSPGVFLVKDVSPALRAEAFDLVKRYVCIPDIETVNSFIVKGAGKTLTAAIKRQDGKTAYSLNGRETSENSFKDFYQACISLSMDAEFPNRPGKPAATEFSIEYTLNTPAGGKENEAGKESVRLAPYNRDFYALVRDGFAEFLVARQQVQNIFTAAEKVEVR